MHRVNIILDEAAWLALQEIPRGERSKAVSQAIAKMAEFEKRIKASKKMDGLRNKIPKVTSSREISNWVREDRKR